MRQTKLDTDERLKFGDELAKHRKRLPIIEDQSGKMPKEPVPSPDNCFRTIIAFVRHMEEQFSITKE
jgi:hypothetical protein